MQPFEQPHYFKVSGKSTQSLPAEDPSLHSLEEKLFTGADDDVTGGLSGSNPLSEGTFTSAFPLPPPSQDLISSTPTPLQETVPPLGASTFVGVCLPGTDIALPTPPKRKAPRNLRLPSFQLLGIAAPHPDNISAHLDHSVVPVGAGPPSLPSDPLHTRSQPLSQPFSVSSPGIADPSPSLSPDHAPPGHKAVQQYVITQTPPDDTTTIDWGSFTAKTAGHMDSAELSSTSDPSPLRNESVTTAAVGPSLNTTSQAGSYRSPWIADALPVIMDSIRREGGSEHVKVLSHALPSPSSTGHAFPSVIDAIQTATGPSSIQWVNVWHAVSGKFSLEDLPKSPPNTPAPPNEGDDYFTTKVFNMAVEVPDYSEKVPVHPLIRKPRPAISPSSIDVSIVERYIPPTSTIEFQELFTPTGRSFLNDRLIELSPRHGTLLFVYPTRAGGQTFRGDYLAPILDPILREMGTTYDLSINLLTAIGTMSAVDKLLSFEEMQSQMREFCRCLSAEGGTPHGRYHKSGAEYSIIHAGTQEVVLDRDVWAGEWWNRQEKANIQRAFENHDVERAEMAKQKPKAEASAQLATATRETQDAAQRNNAKLLQRAKTQQLMRAYERARGEKQPEDNEMLILKLLKSVSTKPYKESPPSRGVEVGVFVIQKTLRDSAHSEGILRPHC